MYSIEGTAGVWANTGTVAVNAKMMSHGSDGDNVRFKFPLVLT
jgi:hypothetical protein